MGALQGALFSVSTALHSRMVSMTLTISEQRAALADLVQRLSVLGRYL
jgi:hypothetical protein